MLKNNLIIKPYSDWLGVSWEIDSDQSFRFIETLSKDIDWLIIDHYAIDEEWESRMRSICQHIMVIDDLANRKHDCDILLDQNYFLKLVWSIHKPNQSQTQHIC